MERRTLLKAAAATVGVPLATLAIPTSARAAAADDYHVAVCEQAKNQILIHPAGVLWTPSNRVWRWAPPLSPGYWSLLSDVKFRNTSAFGWVALVTASGGKVGIVNIGDGDELLWDAMPFGNPHAIERIPNIGAIVTASTDKSNDISYPGFLTVYAPTNSDDPSTLTKVQTIDYQGVHGLWYDGSSLWALGTWTITQYHVTGSHLDTRLEKVWGYTFPTAFNGHSLDTDYADPAYLLVTGGGVTRRLNKATGALTAMTPSSDGVKSLSRARSGEYFWVKALSSSGSGWSNPRVNFFDSFGNPVPDSANRGVLVDYGYDAQFYKARLSSVDFE